MLSLLYKHKLPLYCCRLHFILGTLHIDAVPLAPVMRVMRIVEMPARQCGKSAVSTIEPEN